jgi:hypothetical protein
MGIKKTDIDERPFEDKRAALEYAIRRQRDRRNLTKKELAGFVARAMETLDRVKPAGERSDLASVDARFDDGRRPKSAAETAEKIGVSQATVERVRTVMKSDDAAGEQSGPESCVNRFEHLVTDRSPGRPVGCLIQGRPQLHQIIGSWVVWPNVE